MIPWYRAKLKDIFFEKNKKYTLVFKENIKYLFLFISCMNYFHQGNYNLNENIPLLDDVWGNYRRITLKY